MTSKSYMGWAVALAALSFAAAPFVTEPFSGYTAEQLPVPQPDPVIQPPGWAFSIWGLIYAWLVVGALYGVIRARDRASWTPMRPALLVALLIGTAWLSIAGASAIWGTVTLFLMAGAALVALLRTSREDWAWQAAPVGLFAGWLTAASGVSLAVTLPGFGVLEAYVAGLTSLIAVIVVAAAVTAAKPWVWTYAIGSGWALLGVVITGQQQGNLLIAGLAAVGLVILAGLVVRERG